MRSKERERLPGLDRAPAARGEHVARLLPVGDVLRHTRGGALLGLPVASGYQSGAAESYERKRSHSRGGLDRAAHEATVDAHQAGADEHSSAAEVDVLPAHGGDLAAAQPIDQGEHEHRVGRVVGCSAQENAGLRGSPHCPPGARLGGQGDELGDIAGNELLAHGAAERGAEDYLDHLQLRHRVTACAAGVEVALHGRDGQLVEVVAAESGT
jgi:hypothetical protein